MDALAALRLQIEWGADEALQDVPVDRFAAAPAPAPVPAAGRAQAPVRAAPVLDPAPPAHPARPAPGPVAAATRAAAEATDLAALHAALDGFDACPLRHTAARTVRPSGNPDAGLVLVGEAPGPDDDRSGQAFSGPAGERLDRVLGSAGLSRDRLLLALLVPWRPPGGRPANDTELAACLPFLLRLLALVRPARLVLMGATPVRLLTGETGTIRKLRGRWIGVAIPGLAPPVPALAMLPPDQWLGGAANKQATWSDLLTLAQSIAATPAS